LSTPTTLQYLADLSWTPPSLGYEFYSASLTRATWRQRLSPSWRPLAPEGLLRQGCEFGWKYCHPHKLPHHLSCGKIRFWDLSSWLLRPLPEALAPGLLILLFARQFLDKSNDTSLHILLDPHKRLREGKPVARRQKFVDVGRRWRRAIAAVLARHVWRTSKKNGTGTCKMLEICCKRLAVMRFLPFSYFCTCWNVIPTPPTKYSDSLSKRRAQHALAARFNHDEALGCQRGQNGGCCELRAIQGPLVEWRRWAMSMSLEAAAQTMREAMRETVKRHSLLYLVQGGLMVLAGILALVYPAMASFAAVFLLGCVLIGSGVVQGINLIDAREVPHFWLQLVSVVLSVIVGVLLIRHRAAGLLVLTLLLLVYFMVEGISKVIFSLTIRPFPNWGWVLASGIVTILIAFYLWASLPVTAIWLLGLLLGIQLICEGAALGYLAWKVRIS
jgi:uncharacterized membrane protein HdeD (DUF308 family)